MGWDGRRRRREALSLYRVCVPPSFHLSFFSWTKATSCQWRKIRCRNRFLRVPLSLTHILKVISFSYIKRNCLPATWIQLFYKEKRNKILVRFLFFYSQHCIIIVVHFFLYRSNIIEFTFKIQLIRVSPALFFKILMEVKWPAKTFSDPCTCNITLHIGWLVGRFAQIESPWVCCFFLLHFFCFFKSLNPVALRCTKENVNRATHHFYYSWVQGVTLYTVWQFILMTYYSSLTCFRCCCCCCRCQRLMRFNISPLCVAFASVTRSHTTPLPCLVYMLYNV